jgi:hypothetical protein
MRRRDFISVIVGATTWPFAVRAQQPDRLSQRGSGSLVWPASNHDNITLDELLEQIKVETVKLAPYIDLDAVREAQAVENRLPATGNGSEPEAISPRRRPPRGMGDSSG